MGKDELKKNVEQKKHVLMMRRIAQKERSQHAFWTGNFLEVIILWTQRKGKEKIQNLVFPIKFLFLSDSLGKELQCTPVPIHITCMRCH